MLERKSVLSKTLICHQSISEIHFLHYWLHWKGQYYKVWLDDKCHYDWSLTPEHRCLEITESEYLGSSELFRVFEGEGW